MEYSWRCLWIVSRQRKKSTNGPSFALHSYAVKNFTGNVLRIYHRWKALDLVTCSSLTWRISSLSVVSLKKSSHISVSECRNPFSPTGFQVTSWVLCQYFTPQPSPMCNDGYFPSTPRSRWKLSLLCRSWRMERAPGWNWVQHERRAKSAEKILQNASRSLNC